MPLYPLGKVKELVESVGIGISYAYKDLVFLDHNAFLIQFDEDKSIIVHTNLMATAAEAEETIARLELGAQSFGLKLERGMAYRLTQAAEEQINIEFFKP